MIYNECASPCPRTCFSPRGGNCSEIACYPGCQCPDGMVIDFNRKVKFTCVKLDECMCTYNGVVYPPGSNITADCNNWYISSPIKWQKKSVNNFFLNFSYCANGAWNCTQKKCPRTCAVLGLRHLRTFDGFQYDLWSPCDHVLLTVSFLIKDLILIDKLIHVFE